METLTLRFTETQRYDPMIDAEMVRLMAVTNRGTYHVEVPIDGPVRLRQHRKDFKEHVLGLIDIGTPPCEVEL